MPKNILVISHDKVGPSMAGPGIRYHHIATHLTNHHDVTLGVFNPSYIAGLNDIPYEAIDIHVHHFRKVFDQFDTIIALWLSDEMIEYAKYKGIRLIFDLYAPVPVEDLVQRVFGQKTDSVSDFDYSQMLKNYSHFVNNGDFFLTSNPQQRDLWLGYAFASGAINPSSQAIRGIDTYFGICPMGIDPLETISLGDREILSDRIPAIRPDDFVVVWTGGIWDWFDAQSLIRAMDRLRVAKRTNVKLVFLGTKHPNDDVPAMAETETARNLARELKLIDKTVFFLDGWLPYAERTLYLNRANAAIYAHRPSIEARFSHRTRVLDHILMNLPTIATQGDYFADLIAEKHLGITTPAYDDSALAKAITDLADDKKAYDTMRRNINKIRPDFYWQATLQELVDFLATDTYAIRSYTPRAAQSAADIIINNNKIVTQLKKRTPRKIKSVIKRVIK